MANTFDAADVVIATDVVAVVDDADNVFAIMEKGLPCATGFYIFG